ncbi:MAG TPA: hypothetical protein VFI06_04380, partial [Chitinophagaceae bacterium]|nr:hypothetical protein [Chitinophagaceae bacterium]
CLLSCQDTQSSGNSEETLLPAQQINTLENRSYSIYVLEKKQLFSFTKISQQKRPFRLKNQQPALLVLPGNNFQPNIDHAWMLFVMTTTGTLRRESRPDLVMDAFANSGVVIKRDPPQLIG